MTFQLALPIATGGPRTGKAKSRGRACPRCDTDQWYLRRAGPGDKRSRPGRIIYKCVNCLRTAKRRRRLARHVDQHRACGVCGKDFIAARATKRYCSRPCLAAAARQQSKPPGWQRGMAGPCEICGDPVKQLFWDHDHATGQFRGWLCNNCNSALGYAKDSPDRLTKLIAYLQRPR